MCGDSELCCIKFAELIGKDRKQLEKENEFKDLENLVDLKAVSKTIRYLKRKDEPKKIILDKIQAKYELSREMIIGFFKFIMVPCKFLCSKKKRKKVTKKRKEKRPYTLIS